MQKRILKIAGVILLIYLFLLSVRLLGVSANLFGKGFAEQLIKSCSNPFAGLFIGILATAILQSSSTTTSIVVGLAGVNILPVEYAIPIIMGANIGTTITSILVSLAFVTRKEDFRRAFAGATVHDFFNMCAVIVFFPLELKYGFIRKTAFILTEAFEGIGGAAFTSPLKLLIDPAVNGIRHFFITSLSLANVAAGIALLIIALAAMIFSLICLVKTMRSLIINQAERFVDRYLFKNDFTALTLGFLLTVVVQSSSVTTSLIVPLVAAGIISLKRCYPYTLGTNVGTTFTAILASLATVSVINGNAVNTMGVTVAFAHFTFNLCGIAVFYPLKRIPLFLAGRLAAVAAESKKWAAIFVIGLFLVLPLLMIFLSKYIPIK